MIIGKNRKAVIGNIRRYAESCEFHQKAEVDDPVLTDEQIRRITDDFMESRKHLSFKLMTRLGVFIANIATRIINKDTEIIGIDKIPKNIGGAIITSNHFGPLENTVIRQMTNALGRKKLSIISQASNFAMRGFIGFLMNYAATIPISTDPRYLARDFLSVLKEKLVDKNELILLYPEQEMWFNYRKPRPPKKGAYFYSAKLNIPIISCFVEITDTDEADGDEFCKVRYTLHVLDVLYPDPEKSARENTEELANKDYELKKERYERVYKKPLVYDFESSDIAGWKGTL